MSAEGGLGNLVPRAQVDRVRSHETASAWHRALRGLAAALLARAGFPAGGRLLDVGCGTGHAVLEVGRALGAGLAVGVDYDAYPLRGSAARVAQASGTRLPFAGAAFDGAQCLAVLDHVPAPLHGELLSEVHRVLCPGAPFLLEVPACPWLAGAHDGASNALQRFRAAPLREQCLRAGFQVLCTTHWVHLLFPAVAASRWLDRRPARTDVGRGGAPVEWLLTWTLAMEAFLVVRCGVSLPWGLNLVLLLRRS